MTATAIPYHLIPRGGRVRVVAVGVRGVVLVDAQWVADGGGA